MASRSRTSTVSTSKERMKSGGAAASLDGVLGAVSRNDSRPRRDTSVSNTYRSRPLSGSRPAKRRSTSVQFNAINQGKRQGRRMMQAIKR